MKLRNKIGILVFGAGSFLIILLSIIIQSVMNEAFVDLEDELIVKDINTIKYVHQESVNNLNYLLHDWAAWDDTLNYIRSPTEKYVSSNLVDDVFDGLKLNGFIIVNEDGKKVYNQHYDLKNQQFIDETEKINFEINKIIKFANNSYRTNGYFFYNNEPAFFTTQKISNSHETIKTNGLIILIRTLNDLELEKIQHHSWYPVDFHFKKTIPHDIKYYSETDTYRRISENSIETFFNIYTYEDKELGYFEITYDRGFYKKTQKALSLFVLASFGAIFLITIIIFDMLKYMVVKRVNNINDSVEKIIKTHQLQEKIHVTQDDEIGTLGHNFNIMIKKLYENEIQLTTQNRQLKSANKKLQEIDNLKDSFISNVSHELRTPLTSIKSYTGLFLSDVFGKINKKQKNAITVISSCAEQLKIIITNMLDMSRYEKGKLRLFPEETMMDELVRNAVTEFIPTLEKNKAKVNTSVSPKNKIILIDADKIRQIIRNFISNSIKYKGERKLIINIDIKIKKNLEITFSDNGSGISKENQKHIFEKFFQGVDKSIKRPGTGLGLSIVKYIVDTHKGKIKLQSKLNKGTTFFVSIPFDKKK